MPRRAPQPRTAAPVGADGERQPGAIRAQRRGNRSADPGEAMTGPTRLLPATALAVLTSRPAAGPALAFLQLLLGPPDAALSGGLLLGILDPADELVAGQGRDVLPGIECRRVGDQCLTQVRGQFMHHPPGHSLAAHWPIVVSRGQARSPSAATPFRPTVATRGTCVRGPAGIRLRAGPTRYASRGGPPFCHPTLLLRRPGDTLGAQTCRAGKAGVRTSGRMSLSHEIGLGRSLAALARGPPPASRAAGGRSPRSLRRRGSHGVSRELGVPAALR